MLYIRTGNVMMRSVEKEETPRWCYKGLPPYTWTGNRKSGLAVVIVSYQARQAMDGEAADVYSNSRSWDQKSDGQ